MPRSTLWPDPRVKPPFRSVEIDRGRPIGASIRVVWLMNEGAGVGVYSLGLRHMLATRLVINSGWSVTPFGPGMVFSSANDDLTLEGIDNPFYTMTAPFSLEVLCMLPATVVGYGGLLSCVPASGANGAHFSDSGGSTSAFRPTLVLLAGGTESALWYGTSTITPPFAGHLLATYDGTTGYVYVNGVDQGATTHGALGYGGGLQNRIGRNFYARQNATVVKTAIYNRALSSGEALELAAKPYAGLRPILRRRYFVPAVGPGTKISDAAAVAMAESGKGVSLLVSEGRR